MPRTPYKFEIPYSPSATLQPIFPNGLGDFYEYSSTTFDYGGVKYITEDECKFEECRLKAWGEDTKNGGFKHAVDNLSHTMLANIPEGFLYEEINEGYYKLDCKFLTSSL